ncbi:MAG: hypothetical protein ACKOTE_08440, partial [Opitutaceae bacterium]
SQSTRAENGGAGKPAALRSHPAGPDGVFAAASEVVVLPGNRLRVSAPGIGRPTRVRHGWQALPAGWLLNAAGLPAPPFSARVD